MNPTLLIAASVVAVLAVALYSLHRWSKHARSRALDLGMVSTRWISELRRDEPWGGS
jgi:hypothetical protein